ncbi:MAG: GNAT family N-acetyltransferase [Clostridia bacterium]|nr:GNAT family N-acetyltransferase [Clostridia bacterium]
MEDIRLIPVTAADAQRAAAYRASFPQERTRVMLDPERIPGMDGLESCGSVEEWLRRCESMTGRVTWFMSMRVSDGKVIGFLVLRHSLEEDDDDIEFASHIGYSIRPDERGRGYAKRQLQLGLQQARSIGLNRVRLVCCDTNTASDRTIRACGGVYVDSIVGEESGLRINRYDVDLTQIR